LRILDVSGFINGVGFRQVEQGGGGDADHEGIGKVEGHGGGFLGCGTGAFQTEIIEVGVEGYLSSIDHPA
jgi:hypothetical protein